MPRVVVAISKWDQEAGQEALSLLSSYGQSEVAGYSFRGAREWRHGLVLVEAGAIAVASVTIQSELDIDQRVAPSPECVQN
jgi:hypothetical protein